MKFICTKENLIQALQMVAGITSKPGHLPILSHILVEATESGVTLITTNLEMSVKTHLRAKVEQAGTFTIPGKMMTDYVNLLPDDQIEITQTGNELQITSGHSSTKIKGIPADEFPVIPEVIEHTGYVIPAEELKNALSKVVFAAAKNEIRPELSGVYCGFFVREKMGVYFATTDSYRLAEYFLLVEKEGESIEAIMPAKTAFEIVRLIGYSLSKGEKESAVRLWVSEGQLVVRYGQYELISRMIDGVYPDYTQIIPQTFNTKAIVSADMFSSSIKRASLFVTGGVNAISVSVDTVPNTLAISSMGSQTGEHESRIDVVASGDTNSILLNFRYVLEGIQHMDDEELTFEMNSADTPCIIRPKNSKTYLYIVMPVRK
ncbi:DNA polymerase III subunit beta [Patescibacteria group bacterium]|nr:DNA polymerase III subunit beta [Patescibacteria group bacterium]MBU1721295.1 DNA polymerase III subunit beta [Patescibacteria group bacterium]MBU1900997.1 DNA polymerase III subunit beta [Patescibacteria group bacterium]